MLDYPSPGGFVQAVRLRRRALTAHAPLVVVEGTTDQRALSPLVSPSVRIIPARGRSNVIAAFNELEDDLQKGTLFIIDCDGKVDATLKGHPNLVITTNRDVEADLLFELRALKRLAHEYLGSILDCADDVVTATDALLTDACTISVAVGRVQSTALSLGLPTRLRRGGRRRKLQLGDLQTVCNSLAKESLPSTQDIANDLATIARWGKADAQTVISAVDADRQAACSLHSVSGCDACGRRRYGRGHHLVEAVGLLLSSRHGVELSDSELAAAIRMSADISLIESWAVVERIRRWENGTGLRVIT